MIVGLRKELSTLKKTYSTQIIYYIYMSVKYQIDKSVTVRTPTLIIIYHCVSFCIFLVFKDAFYISVGFGKAHIGIEW